MPSSTITEEGMRVLHARTAIAAASARGSAAAAVAVGIPIASTMPTPSAEEAVEESTGTDAVPSFISTDLPAAAYYS